MTATKQGDRTGLWLATAGQQLCTIAPEGPHRDECLAQATLGAVLCFATLLAPVSIWWSHRRPAAPSSSSSC